jgi:hypothetical protein
LPGGQQVFRFVAQQIDVGIPDAAATRIRLIFDFPAAAAPELVEVVEANLDIEEIGGRMERHRGLGLSHNHSRWMATVLCYESELVYPDSSWIEQDIEPERADFESVVWHSKPFIDGKDRYGDIEPEDFFDSDWTPADDEPRNGIYSLAGLSQVALLAGACRFDLKSEYPGGSRFNR